MGGKSVILAAGISSRMRKSVETAIGIDEATRRKISDPKGMVQCNGRPFLDYLLFNLRESGHDEVLFVVGEEDRTIQEHYGDSNKLDGLSIHYALQRIYSQRREQCRKVYQDGKIRPWGTADALFQGLIQVPEWAGNYATVVNSDNLYSINALSLLLANDKGAGALINYDRDGIEFDEIEKNKFAIIIKDNAGNLADILEKPTSEQTENARNQSPNGRVGVNMNCFRLYYESILPYLASIPEDPKSYERYLPRAVVNMVKGRCEMMELANYLAALGRPNMLHRLWTSSQESPRSIVVIPIREHVPDLTSVGDIKVTEEYVKKHFPDGIKW